MVFRAHGPMRHVPGMLQKVSVHWHGARRGSGAAFCFPLDFCRSRLQHTLRPGGRSSVLRLRHCSADGHVFATVIPPNICSHSFLFVHLLMFPRHFALSFFFVAMSALTAFAGSTVSPRNPSGFAIPRGTNLSHWLSQDFGWAPRDAWITEKAIRFIA